jgi:hypothetical protein
MIVALFQPSGIIVYLERILGKPVRLSKKE